MTNVGQNLFSFALLTASLLAGASAAFAPTPVAQADEKEIQRLQGSWTIFHVGRAGESRSNLGEVFVSGERVRLVNEDGNSPYLAFKISTRSKSKCIDVQLSVDEVYKGIYKFDDETLIICIGTESSARPTAFTESIKNAYLIVFKRIPSRSAK